jgi:GNAT superfamily N-acetyltransferase
MAEWQIERLAGSHDRAGLACGKAPLDAFIRTLVSQYEKRNLGRTYVAVKEGERRAWGYYTLSSSAVDFEQFPADAVRKLPRHPLPCVLLARLAVDLGVKGQGLGGRLLGDALLRCAGLAETLGVHAVEVDAIDDEAAAFYRRHGFVPLADDPLHHFLPISTIERPDA